jgi:hypothetical protein
MCRHIPACPLPAAVDHDAAKIVASHPEQGWNLLCNGIIVFEDTGELIPDDSPVGCRAEPPHRGAAPHRAPVTV